MHTLETKLGYVFHRPELLENALYHSSYANEHRGAGISSNERLEFLGDAVLGFVTAEYLYTKHPDMPEGDLTRIRAALVCEPPVIADTPLELPLTAPQPAKPGMYKGV